MSRAYFNRLVNLAFLAPDITKAILEGRHPPDLTASRLINHTRSPSAGKTNARRWGSPDATAPPIGPAGQPLIGSHEGLPLPVNPLPTTLTSPMVPENQPSERYHQNSRLRYSPA